MEHTTHIHDEEQYIVHNPKEVMQILTNLVKQKVMLKVSFNQGADEYLTTVIAIDTKNHAVHLDIGRDDEFNRRLLASQRVLFLKDEGIRIKWTSTHLTEVTLKDGKAIRIALPQDLIRLQRREFFRFATPIVNPVLCVIPKPNEANPEEESALDFTLLDVSLGGVGVLVVGALDAALVIGTTFDHCKISFPDVGVTDVTLQVKNITQLPAKDSVIKHRVGFQYIAPSRGNEGLINRYVFILERQAIALVHGAR
jgi:c-di-GMP-binding flagellar brake protein YcgR